MEGMGLGGRVYRDLKAALVAREYPSGVRLDLAEVARRLSASTTPVREAAMRLVGEGLLEQDRTGGMKPPALTEHRLRTLLDAHRHFTALALEHGGHMPIDQCDTITSDMSYEQRVRLVFRNLVSRTANAEILDAVERISDRLSPFVYLEPSCLAGAAEEIDRLSGLLTDDAVVLRPALRRYYRRREHVIPQLVCGAVSTLTSELKPRPDN